MSHVARRDVYRALMLIWIAATAAVAEDRLPARVRLTTRAPLYVGQEIALEVTTVAGGQRPALRLPNLDGASLAVAGQALRPISSNAIGSVVNETIQYGWRLRLVPTRAGTLVVPSITMESGERSGKTAPLRLDVRPPPTAGRPAAFLGGVGPIEAHLEVRPAAVRVQEPAEVRLVLDGPGARGSIQPMIDLQRRLERLAIAPEVQALPAETSDDPPRRVRRFRMRPTRAGEVSLPPVVVSWFDPVASRYQSTLAGAVSLRVVELPRLDPSAVVGLTREKKPAGRFSPWWLRGSGIASLLAAAGMLGWLRWRRWEASPRREAGRQAERLRAIAGRERSASVAEAIEGALTSYLQRATARSPGVLTPHDAAEGILRTTGRDDLADAAHRLVERCDQVRYDGRSMIDDVDGASLRAEAIRLLEQIAGGRRIRASIPTARRSGR